MKKVISLSATKTQFGPLLFSGDLALGLKRAGELGYDGVELSLRDSKEMDIKELQRSLTAYGLQVCAIATGQTYYNDGYSLFAEEAEKRSKALERMKGHVDLASQLGQLMPQQIMTQFFARERRPLERSVGMLRVKG